jgi:hypothetical protein
MEIFKFEDFLDHDACSVNDNVIANTANSVSDQ